MAACQPQSMLTTLGPGAILGLKPPISFRGTFARFSGFVKQTRGGLWTTFWDYVATSSFRSATTSRYRKLIVNESEAATVRMIFERYAREGSAPALVRALEAEGITGKRGKPIDKGYLFMLLNNPIYVGDAARQGMAYPYPGEYEAIVERALWDRVHVRVDGDGR